MPPGPTTRYTWVAIILHWTIALGVLGLVVMGWVMTHARLSPMRLFQLYQLHKSVGVTILLAAVLRLAWRLTNRPPELPADMSGWALVSASVLDIPTVLFGVIPWPDLPGLPHKAPAEDAFKALHAWLAWGLLALVGLHAAAALRHHFVKRDPVLIHMLPFVRAPRAPERISR
jgi:cytochrome b561